MLTLFSLNNDYSNGFNISSVKLRCAEGTVNASDTCYFNLKQPISEPAQEEFAGKMVVQAQLLQCLSSYKVCIHFILPRKLSCMLRERSNKPRNQSQSCILDNLARAGQYHCHCQHKLMTMADEFTQPNDNNKINGELSDIARHLVQLTATICVAFLWYFEKLNVMHERLAKRFRAGHYNAYGS